MGKHAFRHCWHWSSHEHRRRVIAAVSGVAILMGLNLLGALPLRLPSLDMDVRQLSLPPLAQASTQGAHCKHNIHPLHWLNTWARTDAVAPRALLLFFS